MTGNAGPAVLVTSSSPLRVWRGGRLVVDRPASFEVKAGEVVAIVGDNGTGKTAVLLSILGLLDSSITTNTTRLGYVPQRLVPPPSLPLTVSDTLRLLGHPEHTHHAIHKGAGVMAPLSRPVSALSTGELMRVMIAAACNGHPALLLLDEPTAALDAAAGARVRQQVADVVATGTGVVLVSHNQRDIDALATRVVQLTAESS